MPEKTEIAAIVGSGAAAFLTGLLATIRNIRRQRDLKHHPFFPRMKAVYASVSHLPIADPFRREVFQDLLKIKIRAWEEETRKFLDCLDWSKMTDEQFQMIFENFVCKTVALYERQAEEEGIPMDVIYRFRQWHQPSVDGFIHLVSDLCDSDWISTPHRKMVSFLFALLGALEHTCIDAEKTLADLNGSLDGQVYKGFVANHWESPKRLRQKVKEESGAIPAFKPLNGANSD